MGQLVTQETFLTYLETETNAAGLVKPAGPCCSSEHHQSHAVLGGRAGAGGTRGDPGHLGPGCCPGRKPGSRIYHFFCVPRLRLRTELPMRRVRLGKEQQQLLLAARRKSVNVSAVSKVPRRVRLKGRLEQILERLW